MYFAVMSSSRKGTKIQQNSYTSTRGANITASSTLNSERSLRLATQTTVTTHNTLNSHRWVRRVLLGIRMGVLPLGVFQCQHIGYKFFVGRGRRRFGGRVLVKGAGEQHEAGDCAQEQQSAHGSDVMVLEQPAFRKGRGAWTPSPWAVRFAHSGLITLV